MLNLSDNKVSMEDERLKALAWVQPSGKSRRIARTLAWIFGVLFLGMFLPWQQNINGAGKLTALNPAERPQTINTIIPGRIERWNIQEGQWVRKGDTILVLSEIKDKFFDPELLTRMEGQIKNKQQAISSKNDKIQSLGGQVDALQDGLRQKLAQARNKIIQAQLKVVTDSNAYISARLDYTVADTQLRRAESLFTQGLVSLTQLESKKIKAQESSAKLIGAENKLDLSRNEMINAYLELNAIEADYLDKIRKSESTIDETSGDLFDSEADLAKLKIEFSNMRFRNGLYIIRAPQNGYIVKALKAGIGDIIKEGEEVTTIMPANGEKAVEIYVRAMDVPLLYKGVKVRLQFDGWPALVFSGWPGVSSGTFGGVVSVVDYVASTDGKFRVLITPDPADRPWPAQLRIGSGVYGWAMLNEVRVWKEIWRQFNGFPPDLVKELPNPILPEKSKNNKKEEENP